MAEKMAEKMAEEMAEEKETVEKAENNEPSFMEMLDDATDAHVKETESRSESNEPDKKKNTVPDKDKSGEEVVQEDLDNKDGGEKEEDGGDGEPAVDEALLERAVRAGMGLADARAVVNQNSLENIIGRLEEAGKKIAESGDKKSATGEEKSDEDLLKEIPDLDPEEYSEEVVGAFKGLKAMVAKQQKFIASLKQDLDSRGTWVDERIAELGKDFNEVFGRGNYTDLREGKQKTARDKLLRHVEFAELDTKESGESLTHAEIFKLALKSGFGETLNQIKGKVTTKAAAERAKKVINQPRSTTGRLASGNDYGNKEDREADATKAVAAMMESD